MLERRRRMLGFQRDKPEEEVKLFNKRRPRRRRARPTRSQSPLNRAGLDEAERAFDRAEAARKGKQHPVASARWRLPLDPTMKLAPAAKDLNKCKKYLGPFDEDDFEELGELVKRMEHGATSNPHLYPVS